MEPTLAARALTAATEITTAALSGDDPAAVLDLVVRSAARLAEADLGLVMSRGPQWSLTVEAAHGAGPLDPVGLVLSTRSSAARAARSGVPVVVDDVTTDPRTSPFVPRELRGYGPFAAAPFGTRERGLGALTVYRRLGRPPFTSATVDVLAAFAAQAGLVLLLADGTAARERLGVHEERERIARDLHDVIVQRLYAAGMQLDLLARRPARKLARPDATRLADAVDLLDASIGDVRAVVRTLRNPDPAEPAADFADSVRAEVATAGELLGFDPVLELAGDVAGVPVAVADDARAALREALSNVVRHAGATALDVAVRRTGGGLRVLVRDNGCGIPRGVSRRGLENLRERAEHSGGRCRIESSPKGTSVSWEVPV